MKRPRADRPKARTGRSSKSAATAGGLPDVPVSPDASPPEAPPAMAAAPALDQPAPVAEPAAEAEPTAIEPMPAGRIPADPIPADPIPAAPVAVRAARILIELDPTISAGFIADRYDLQLRGRVAST